MREPSEVHYFDQLHARAVDIARVVGSYYQALLELCVDERRAWECARDLEIRLWERELPDVWADDSAASPYGS